MIEPGRRNRLPRSKWMRFWACFWAVYMLAAIFVGSFTIAAWLFGQL